MGLGGAAAAAAAPQSLGALHVAGGLKGSMGRAFQLCGLYTAYNTHTEADRLSVLHRIHSVSRDEGSGLQVPPMTNRFWATLALAKNDPEKPKIQKPPRKPKASKMVKQWGVVNDRATLVLPL